MKIKKKHLKTIEVEVNKEGGFTVWITEKKVINGQKESVKHWILDGSCIKKDGKIRLGNSDYNDINAVHREQDNTIYVVKK